MRVTARTVGWLEAPDEEHKTALVLPLTFLLQQTTSPAINAAIVEDLKIGEESTLATGAEVEFYEEGVLSFDRTEEEPAEGSGKLRPIKYAVFLRALGPNSSNNLDLRIPTSCPKLARTDTTLPGFVRIRLTFRSASFVTLLIRFTLNCSTRRVLVEKISRVDRPWLVRLAALALFSALGVLTTWNEAWNKDVYGQTWLSAENVDKAIFFLWGFFGLSALLILLKHLGGVQALWDYPEVYLPPETVRFLRSRLTLATLSLILLLLIAAAISLRSVEMPMLPNTVWLSSSGQPLVNDRVFLKDLAGFRLVCGTEEAPSADSPSLAVGVPPEPLDWLFASAESIRDCHEFELTGSALNTAPAAAGCTSYAKLNGCTWQSDPCFTSLRPPLQQLLCGAVAEDAVGIVPELEVLSGPTPTTARRRVISLTDPRRLTSFEEVLRRWTSKMRTPATLEDLAADSSFHAEALASEAVSGISAEAKFSRQAFRDTYKDLYRIFKSADRERSSYAMLALESVIRLYRDHQEERLVKEDFEQFAQDFRDYYSVPRGERDETTGEADQIGDQLRLRLYLRFLLQVELDYFTAPEVGVIDRTILAVSRNRGDRVYVALARECVRLDLLFRERDDRDVYSERRALLSEGLSRVLRRGTWARKALERIRAEFYVERRREIDFLLAVLPVQEVDLENPLLAEATEQSPTTGSSVPR